MLESDTHLDIGTLYKDVLLYKRILELMALTKNKNIKNK